jgi:hypothetical protein
MSNIVKKKSTSSNEQRLNEWLQRNAYQERDEGNFIKVVVRHIINKSKTGEEIFVLSVPQDPKKEGWAEDLARDIVNQLMIEASQFGGMQHYAAYSYFDGVSDKHINRCIVSIQGTTTDDDDGFLSEAPDAKGLVSQAMRHQEANARILMASVSQIVDSMRRQNDRLVTFNEKLIDSRFELLGEVQELLDDKNRRDNDNKREAAKIAAWESGAELVKQLAPVVLNKAMGKQVFPESMAGIRQVASTFSKSLTEEQVKNLMGGLNDAQKIQFYSILESLTDEKNEKGQSGTGPINGTQ